MLARIFQFTSRLRGFLLRSSGEAEFDQELAAHLEMAVEEKMRAGLDRRTAEREARVELGGLTQLRESRRELSGLPALDTLGLDVRLGLRMLRKHLGMTLIGGLAMTVAITLAVLVFAFFEIAFGGSLPLEEGERVVAIEVRDTRESARRPLSLRDVERWQDSSVMLEDIGAFRTVQRNLMVDPSAGEEVIDSHQAPNALVRVAQISPSGFRLTRIPPERGRPLVDADAEPGALPVVVIGHQAWQTWFDGDANVLGKVIRLGETVHTVVGVMPEKFLFPVNHHFWTALAFDAARPLGSDEEATVFARLAPNATRAGAEAELASIGLLPVLESGSSGNQGAVDHSEEDEVQAQVLPYPLSMVTDSEPSQMRWVIRMVLLLGALLLAPPCANVAILVYARTMARQEEFVARHALGASRGRMVGQLFVEMLVLSLLSAAAAVGITSFALRWFESSMDGQLADGPPFWMSFRVGPSTVLFAIGLAVIAALIAGLLPALKAMGQRRLAGGMRSLGSRSGLQLGATWTALVVIQVGICLGALPLAIELTWGTMRNGVLGSGLAAEQVLTARLSLDREPGVSSEDGANAVEFDERFAAMQASFRLKVEQEVGVRMTTFGTLPGNGNWMLAKAVADGDAPGPGPANEDGQVLKKSSTKLVRVNTVDARGLSLYGLELLAGRGFETADLKKTNHAVIVDRALAERLYPGGHALGEHIHYRDSGARRDLDQWTEPFEIVGVVADRSVESEQFAVYHAIAPGASDAVSFAALTAGNADALGQELRRLAAEVSPGLRVDEIQRLDAIYRHRQVGNNLGVGVIVAIMGCIVLLSAGGLYALLSFTIDQRRKEIGIRSAMGAPPHRLVASVFRKASLQVGLGAVVGILLAVALDRFLPAERVGGWEIPGVIPAAAVMMLAVAVCAGMGPARRGLRVDALEELRES